jgi:predicted CXXCH cytochrome family protein
MTEKFEIRNSNLVPHIRAGFLGVLLALSCWSTRADTILASKHDLSSSGPGTIKATAESDVCGFCHTPHRGTGETPLWNHAMSTASYIPYSSSTTRASIGQPTGASKLCLSCHDGTVALGMVANRTSAIQMQGGVTSMPVGRANVGTDLSDDHPISFTYNSALVAANGELRDPATLTDKVRVDRDQQMQCTSCHDPHDNRFGKFLVKDNTASALCVTCHTPNYWQAPALIRGRTPLEPRSQRMGVRIVMRHTLRARSPACLISPTKK